MALPDNPVGAAVSVTDVSGCYEDVMFVTCLRYCMLGGNVCHRDKFITGFRFMNVSLCYFIHTLNKVILKE